MHVIASFEWSVIWDNRGPLWDGFKNTMKAGAVGIVLAYLVGLVLGAMRPPIGSVTLRKAFRGVKPSA
jgi:ABC-type amino acid transport system permease subunit